MAEASGTAKWALAVSIISVAIAGVAIFANIFVGSFNLGATRQTAGYYCTQWESWVIDRIKDGLSDQAIGQLTMIAIQAGSGAGNLLPTYPTPTPSSSLTAATASPPVSSSTAATTPTTNAALYQPCSITTEADSLGLIRQIRGAMSGGNISLSATTTVAATTT